MKILFPILFILFVIACNEEPGDFVSERDIDSEKVKNLTGSKDYSVYPFLTSGIWEYRVVAPPDSVSDFEVENRWIDFHTDGIYIEGYGEDTITAGKYDYNHVESSLLLSPELGEMESYGYRIMHRDNVMIFVGQKGYKTYNYQIKLERI